MTARPGCGLELRLALERGAAVAAAARSDAPAREPDRGEAMRAAHRSLMAMLCADLQKGEVPVPQLIAVCAVMGMALEKED